MKFFTFVRFLLLFCCACSEYELPDKQQPIAGSRADQEVDLSTQALTPTVTLQYVFNHFGLGVAPTFTLLSGNLQYVKANLSKTLWTRVGDTAYVELKHGHWPSVDTALNQLCVDLSNRRLWVKVNGAYVQGLNLEGKLVVNR